MKNITIDQLEEQWTQLKDESPFEEKLTFFQDFAIPLYDYALRMSGQCNPINQNIESLVNQNLYGDSNYDRPFKDLLIDFCGEIRRIHTDIWMNNTDELTNPVLNQTSSLSSQQTATLLKAERILNKLYPHAKELLILKHWFGLSFDEISQVIEDDNHRTEKLYQQAIQHFSKSMKQSENHVVQTLKSLPYHEKPEYSRHETQELSKIMQDVHVRSRGKSGFLWTAIVLIIMGLIAFFVFNK